MFRPFVFKNIVRKAEPGLKRCRSKGRVQSGDCRVSENGWWQSGDQEDRTELRDL